MQETFLVPDNTEAFAFRAFGATLKIDSNDRELLDTAKEETSRALIEKLDFIDAKTAAPDKTYGLYCDGDMFRLYENGDEISFGESRSNFLNFYNALLRVAVGEHSELFVFLHAGVVGWNGKAIIMPANSYNGKTTLVAELIKCGAEYYSDEYALIDKTGNVHPFARDLSMRRDDKNLQEEIVPVESIGGKAGTAALPVGMLLLTRYIEGYSFAPEVISLGNGIIETVPFAITVRSDPDRTIEYLSTALKDALIIKSPRGEAIAEARAILSYFDSKNAHG
jgi:hypothetical protein